MNTETKPSELAMKIAQEIVAAEIADSVYAVFNPEDYAEIVDRHTKEAACALSDALTAWRNYAKIHSGYALGVEDHPEAIQYQKAARVLASLSHSLNHSDCAH